MVEDLNEKCLAEMLFYMEQMRRLVRKYDKVIKTYYVQYLSCYDVLGLKECIKVRRYVNFVKVIKTYPIIELL